MISKLLLVTSASALIMGSVFAGPVPKADERKLYVGSNSTEAKMTFTGSVQIESATKPTAKAMREQVASQVEHTIGPMSFATYKAVPKGDETFSNIKVASKDGSTYTISYNYTGTIVLQNGAKGTYDLVMPINPKTIYAAAMVGNHNPCTDEHYQTEGDFWYFWNPSQAGCKLVEGTDYTVVSAKVERISNTKLTYPEYQNLPDENGITNIHVLFGMDDPTKSRDPLKTTDINADNFRDFRNYLIAQGYKGKKWTTAEVTAIAKTKNGALPYVETLQKGNIAYRFFFGPTGIDEESTAFHWFYKDAIEHASIMIYGGHSGLGGHLDLASIEQDLGESINFNPNKYQIFFFDSCTSYRYYNQAYFERKATTADPKGTKSLDIFTNGLSTYFTSMPTSNRSIAVAVDKALNAQSKGVFASYQTLAKQIDSDNLFGINGDEDNEAPKSVK